jgi:hypothetical protein
MSNTTEKLAIANTALFTLSHTQISAISDATVDGKRVGLVIESVIKELMADDWYFNRHQVLLSDMTQIYKLTIDTAPSPAIFKRGATITGASSGVTCTVLDSLSDKVYLVTEPSGDFTDGEVLSDGTNSVDCAAGYPQATEDLEIDQYQYGFKEPDDCIYIRGIFDFVHDKIKYEHKMYQNIILSHYNDNCWFKYNFYRQESVDVSDVTGIKPWFHRLCSAKLAWMMSANITDNQKIRAKVEIDYNNAYLEAKEKNGSEEGAIDWSGNNDWADGANNDLELYDY